MITSRKRASVPAKSRISARLGGPAPARRGSGQNAAASDCVRGLWREGALAGESGTELASGAPLFSSSSLSSAEVTWSPLWYFSCNDERTCLLKISKNCGHVSDSISNDFRFLSTLHINSCILLMSVPYRGGAQAPRGDPQHEVHVQHMRTPDQPPGLPPAARAACPSEEVL